MTNNSASTFKLFLKATRPRTFPLAIASIICGNALAFSDIANLSEITGHNYLVFLLTLWVALALQILSNLANDYGDGVKGTDDLRDATSPERVMAQGTVSSSKFKRIIFIWAFITFWSGVALIAVGFDNLFDFLVFLAFGIVAILAAMAYTMGNRPYGYRAMGEVAVLIFFGWLAVLGSAYLQTGQFELRHMLPATGCGGLAACVLYVNNMRDVYSDKKANKITLAVMLGDKKMAIGYFILLLTSMICYLLYALFYNIYTLFVLVALPGLCKHFIVIAKSTSINTNLVDVEKTGRNNTSVDKADVVKIGGELKTIVLSCLVVNILFAYGIFSNHLF